MVALYIAGNSIIHKMPLLVKIILLVLVVLMSYVLDNIYYVGAVVACIFCGFLIANIPLRYFFRALKLLLAIFVGIALYYLLLIKDWQLALIYIGRVIIAVECANLISFTTPLHVLISKDTAMTRGLSRMGIPMHSIRIMIYIVLRTIPILTFDWYELKSSLNLRGRRRNNIILIFPLLLRSVLQTDQLVDALVLRGEIKEKK